MYKKRLCGLLLCAALVLSFAACGGGTGNAETSGAETSGADGVSSAASTEPAETAVSVSNTIEKRDFKGAKFNILGRNDGTIPELHAYELTAESLNGDIVNDAVYGRNSSVGEYLNVKITAELLDRSAQQTNLQNSVLANDGAYDLACGFLGSMTPLATGGYLADFYSIPGLDPTADWWNGTVTENLTIGGKLLLAVNDIPFTSMLLTHCMFMNKNLAPDYKAAGLYDTVRAGGWTLDALLSLTANTRRDLNGDGKFDGSDFYGFMSSYGAIGIFTTSCDQPIMSVDGSGKVTLEIFCGKMQSIVEKTYKLAYDNGGTYLVLNELEPAIAKQFAAGGSLFYSGFFSDPLLYFRDMKDDFALIPFPKYDEGQDAYYSSITGGNGLLGVPKAVKDAQLTGLVTEALALESWLSVRPAVLETVMVGKLLRDDASEEMFNLIQSGVRADFGFLYASKGYGRTLRDLMQNKSTDLASYYASREEAAKQYYAEVVAAYTGAAK